MKRALFIVLLLAACKQGRGGRCQVTADCESPLICTQSAPGTCVDTLTGQFDAGVPDGPPADAAVGDAPADATPADSVPLG